MAKHLNVQASLAMFSTIDPEGWTVVFGVYVTDENGDPVTGLTKSNFHVWELTTIFELDVQLSTEVNLDFPASKLPGVYRVQTKDFLGFQAPAVQQFVHAIRVAFRRRKTEFEGITTTPVSYFGKPK